MSRLCPILFLAATATFAQSQPPTPQTATVPPDEVPVGWVCPMDRDVRATQPGKCPRCGMALVPGIPPFREYPTRLRTNPRLIKPRVETAMRFEVLDPQTRKRVTEFEVVHERLFHLFLVSWDLQFFAHEHPDLQANGEFKFEWKFPAPGMYRVLTDFYPKGGTPQLTTNTLFVAGPGASGPVSLKPDLGPQKSENLTATLTMDPPQPLAGFKTLMFFDLNPGEGLEKYLGAWGHMLAASEDLVDMIHNHPFLADGGARVQFNMIFPRPGVYRVWVQFQRKGVVNTVAFNVPVVELK
jgi:hypothetical protein